MKKSRINALIIVVCLAIFIISLSTVFILKNSSQIHIALLEQKYKKSNSEVDLINLFYKLQNTNENDKKIYYTKILIDKITFEGVQNSDFKELYNESFADESPKDVIILFYFENLLDAKKYSLIPEEFPLYCIQMQKFGYLDMFLMKRYGKTGDENIPLALISGYENLYKSTDDSWTKETCLVHIDSIKLIVDETQSAKNNQETVP